ncbi:MAG: hypothetical protein WD871_10445 [Xanthobacteraceae bacterium]
MQALFLATIAFLLAASAPGQAMRLGDRSADRAPAPAQLAGNTSSNTSSNTSCNSSNGRTSCVHTHDWSVETSGNRGRNIGGSTRVERYAPAPERYWRERRERRWQFGDDD